MTELRRDCTCFGHHSGKSRVCWSIAVIGFAVALVIASASTATAVRVERALEWNQLFYHYSGWTGADGGFSIPLSGVYAPGTSHLGPTLFTFGDTFIGEVSQNRRRLPGSTIVNNTFSLLPPFAHEPGAMRFIWLLDGNGEPRAVFIPNTPNAQPDDWYWPADGFANRELGGDLYIFHFRLRGHGFTGVGVSLVVVPVDSPNPIADHRQFETPLFRPGDKLRKAIGFGNSVIVNTTWAQAPDPDGYVYVYGHEEGSAKKLLVCRIRPDEIENPDAWRFWNGSDWVEDIVESAPFFSAVTGNISVELLPDGRVVALHADFSGHIRARLGEGVVGPFGPVRIIYRTPEIDYDPDIITYNPIAHSHLSQPGELLINYSVNSLDFGDLFSHADWYLPKFIRVVTADLDAVPEASTEAGEDSWLSVGAAGKADESTSIPSDLALLRNHPNPFNAATTISYQLLTDSHVKLQLYNLLGDRIEVLVDERQEAGDKSVSWDASEVASGIYFYRLTAGDFTEARRMMLVR
jgi:hypothetical protein